MHNSRNRISLTALLIGVLGHFMDPKLHAQRSAFWPRQKGPSGRNPFRGVYSSNRSDPHQGPREMARRRGGSDWAAWKAGERKSRGLPAMNATGA